MPASEFLSQQGITVSRPHADVIPADLIAGIVTEEGIWTPKAQK
jgi:methylthioribose-1-phosphate isomerase